MNAHELRRVLCDALQLTENQIVKIEKLREVLNDHERTTQAKALGWDIDEMRRIVNEL